MDRLTFFGSSGWAEEIIANTGESPNRLFHTNDGGAHWTEVTLAHCTGCGVMGVVFATSTTMISIAAPSGGGLPVPVEVAVTHDGGRTWHHMTLGAAMDVWSARGGFSSDGTYGLLTFENFHGSQSLGQTQVWSTSDGGARWHKVADGAPAGDVEVVTSRLAFIAVTQQDSLERSTDGGATWHPVLQGALSAPHFSDNTHGSVLVGQYDQAYSLSSVALYRTSNGGSTWQAGARLVDPSLANDGAGTGLPAWAGRGSAEAVLVIGEDVWVTNDGGSTWSQTATGVSIAASALAIAPNGIMFAADFGETCPGKTNCVSFAAFLASSDGGHTWKDVHQP